MEFSTPKYFLIKKYLLMILSGFYIVFLAFYPLIANSLGDEEISKSHMFNKTMEASLEVSGT